MGGVHHVFLPTTDKEICEPRVRYGYRRVHVRLRWGAWTVNPKRIYRLYKEMRLQLRELRQRTLSTIN
ncbi:MAG: transposase [Mesorhizobium sp.]|nr:MAG: transposase [Mesorhizobium sp.]TIP83515.1 MAG: transposase [Mesorhizobium sp.]TJW49854.1 MAG: transposase [Mesorhizobium sp.]